MLIRSNPNIYPPMFTWDHRGILLITKSFIFATKMFAFNYKV